MIIGINGYIGSGKDTVGQLIIDSAGYWQGEEDDMKFLWYDQPWEIKKFAGKLKQIATLLTGIPIEKFEDQDFKKTNLSSEWDVYGMPTTVREFLQRLGTEAVRENIHNDAWVNALFADYVKQRRSYTVDDISNEKGFHTMTIEDDFFPNWIITDTRFPNEAKAIKNRGGVIIRINRMKAASLEDKGILHPSEISLDDWKFDYTIDNSGTLDELRAKVEKIMDEIHYKNESN